jgi:hypothetical protein
VVRILHFFIGETGDEDMSRNAKHRQGSSHARKRAIRLETGPERRAAAASFRLEERMPDARTRFAWNEADGRGGSSMTGCRRKRKSPRKGDEMNLPVFYATNEGHTRRIAERVAAILRERGFSSSAIRSAPTSPPPSTGGN